MERIKNRTVFINKKAIIDGIQFDSKREAARYKELKLFLRAGQIRDLKVHTKRWLVVNGRSVLVRSSGYPNGRRASYTDDFSYETYDGEKWYLVIEDVKGYDTSDMRFRRGVFEAMSGIEIRLVL